MRAIAGPITLAEHLTRVYQRAFDAVAAEQYYGRDFCHAYAQRRVKEEREKLDSSQAPSRGRAADA